MALAPINVGGVALAIPPRPAGFSTPPASLSVDTYVDWPVSDQADYVQLNGAGVPPSVKIGPSGSQQIIATVPTGGFAVDIVYLPAAFNTAPSSLSAMEFLDWNAAQQTAYLNANGGASVTVGAAGSLQVTVTPGAIAGGAPTITYLAPPPAPTLASPLPFAEWPIGFQLAYLNTYGTGSPKSAIIGTDAGDHKILASIGASGQSVTIQTLPVEFTKPPSQLDAKLFLSWTLPVQQAYITSTGLPQPITIGLTSPAGSPQIRASVGTVAPIITFLAPAVAVASLTVGVFQSWHVGTQLAYLNANGTGTPKSIVLQNASVPEYVAAIDASGNGTEVFPLPANFTTAPSSLKMDDFLAWNGTVQLAYIDINGTGGPPKSVTLPVTVGVSEPVLRAAAAAFLPTLTYVAPTILRTSLTLALFSSWPIGHQLAYVNANGSGSPRTMVFGATAGPQYAATINVAAGIVDVSAQLPSNFGTSPTTLDATAFLKWDSDIQLAYVRNNGGGPLDIGTAAGGKARATISGNALTFVFIASTTTPGTLARDTFLAWDPLLQVAYVSANGVSNPKTIEIGTGTSKILTYLQTRTASNGATVQSVEVAFPPTEFYTARTSLTASSFLGFSERLRVAYVRLNGPEPVVVGTSGTTDPHLSLTTTTSGGGVISVVVQGVSPDIARTTLDPVVFLSWPAVVRLDYVNDKGTIVAPATTKSVVIGRSGDRLLTATMNAAGTSLSYDDYWSAQAQTPPPSIIDAISTPDFWSSVTTNPTIPPTPIPYFYLAGSDVGVTSIVNKQTADAKFPTYDGASNQLPNDPPAPANGVSYKADEFLSMHSAHQLEILKGNSPYVTYSANVSVTGGGTRRVMTVGSGTDTVTVVEGTLPDELFIVEHLQKRDFATMLFQDQEAVAKTAKFGTIAATFGLMGGTDPATNRNAMIGLADTAINEMKVNSGFYNAGSPPTIKAGYTDPPAATSTAPGSMFTGADLKVFTDEIQNIKDRLNNHMAVFSQTDIAKSINDIQLRFKRAEAFASVPNQARPPQNNIEYILVSNIDVPEKSTINAGYRKFMEQERRLLSLENARLALSNSGATENKKLDAPNLVFLYQLYYNLTAEAKVSADTEEVNQQNALLKVYTEMQRLVNVTKQSFTETDSKKAQEEKHGLLGKSGFLAVDPLDDQSMRTAAMFEDYLAGSGANLAKHPIEEINGITRPSTQEFFANANATPAYSQQLRTWWDSVATQLSDTVSLINQNSQIKMNDINSMDKQKNRHFDLANSALQKMNEIISNIARSGG